MENEERNRVVHIPHMLHFLFSVGSLKSSEMA